MNKNLSTKATDPKQYDSNEIDWTSRGAEDSPSRKHFRDSLESILQPDSFQNKKILDIGSGVGQLFNFLREIGSGTFNLGHDAILKNESMNKNLSTKATDPRQYDSSEIDWTSRGAEDSPSRKHFRDSLESIIQPDGFQNKKILDIGSGVGQLFNFLKEKGASKVVGIDPSTRNIARSTELYPWAQSVCATLEEFVKNSSEKFDIAIAILVFEHIEDLHSAFADVKKLLNKEGTFYLIVGDKDFQTAEDKTQRKNLISVEVLNDLGDGAVEIKTVKKRPEGVSVLYDIFRPIEHFINAAEANGFKLQTTKPVFGLPGSASEKVVTCHMFEFIDER
jgi:2-polyprenyl-3-methyl-5-hydroxy-6-metoxy-1,4-benzoquinol methylase